MRVLVTGGAGFIGSHIVDAYLAAGAVQGGLAMLGDMIDIGITRSEVQDQLRQLLERADRVDESHPGLDEAIEERRV